MHPKGVGYESEIKTTRSRCKRLTHDHDGGHGRRFRSGSRRPIADPARIACHCNHSTRQSVKEEQSSKCVGDHTCVLDLGPRVRSDLLAGLPKNASLVARISRRLARLTCTTSGVPNKEMTFSPLLMIAPATANVSQLLTPPTTTKAFKDMRRLLSEA
jgi:hypothetical protein